MSYEEFLRWSNEDTHAEWVNGEVIIKVPPKDVHQSTVGFLYELLSLFVRLFDLGRVRVAPFEVKLGQGSKT
jgi:Uma2 family endonuclease